MQAPTRRKFVRALRLINDYREKQIGLGYLVDSWEGTLDSLEERMPEEFYNVWFEAWGELEVVLALQEEASQQDQIQRGLKGLEKLLSEVVGPDSESDE